MGQKYWNYMKDNNASAFQASQHFGVDISKVWEPVQKPKVTMCTTPKTMKLDLCKNCLRSTKHETRFTKMHSPKKKRSVWQCDGQVYSIQNISRTISDSLLKQ